MGRLEGKIALITGGTRGIGRGIVTRFAAEGAKVVFLGRTVADGEAVEQEVKKSGGDVTFVRADVSSEDDIRGAVAEAVKRYGGLTTLINNAAATDLGTIDGPIANVETQAWEQIMRINLTGVFFCTKYALKEMVKGKGGTIVNISSVASIAGLPANSAYTASKGALNSLTRSIALDYAPAGVRCNCLVLGLHPGDRWSFFLTDPKFRDAMQAVHLTPRFGLPDDVAQACVYMSSDESGFVTGAQLTIDGGVHSATRFPMQTVTASYSEYKDENKA